MYNPLTLLLSLLLFPVTLISSWRIVGPQTVVVLVYWGKLSGRLSTPGIHFVLPWGLNAVSVGTQVRGVEIHKTTVADKNGNPVVIAGVCAYRVVDPEKASFAVSNATNYVEIQAVAAIKQVAAAYPYESPDGHSLRGETTKVSGEMVKRLQERVSAAGMEVVSFDISDLAYSPEIAQAMLVRQQAEALVGARKVIVHGAVEIVHDALTELEKKGVSLDVSQRGKLIGNLLTVICGDAKVQPTYAINDDRN